MRDNAFGASGSTLTINGTTATSVQLTSGNPFTGSTQNLGVIEVLSDFRMDGGNYGTILVTGSTAVNLNSATRTIKAEGPGNASLGNSFFAFSGSGQTINDGTLRIVGDSGSSATAPSYM